MKPDVGDGVEALAKTGLKKEIKKEGIPTTSAVEGCSKETGLIDKPNVKPHGDAGDLGKKIDTSVKLEFNQKFTDISHLPPLRQEYIRKVWGIEETVHQLFNEGKTSEQVAHTVSQMRRDFGIKYKDRTPVELRERIYARNIKDYEDPLGPTIEYFRKKGKSWEQIIESACRVGGEDLFLGPK